MSQYTFMLSFSSKVWVEYRQCRIKWSIRCSLRHISRCTNFSMLSCLVKYLVCAIASQPDNKCWTVSSWLLHSLHTVLSTFCFIMCHLCACVGKTWSRIKECALRLRKEISAIGNVRFYYVHLWLMCTSEKSSTEYFCVSVAAFHIVLSLF